MEIRAPKGPGAGHSAADEQTLTPEQLSLVRTDIIEAIRDDWMGRTRRRSCRRWLWQNLTLTVTPSMMPFMPPGMRKAIQVLKNARSPSGAAPGA